MDAAGRALVELTRVELAEVGPSAVLVVPFGAVEQHGTHLPFGTDFRIVDEVARRAAARAAAQASLVVAPTLPYGSSDHHLEVGGALSLSAATFEACARDLLAAAAASGFRRVFVVNGHGGNEALLRVAAQTAVGDGRLTVAGGSYWELARPALEAIVPHPSLIPGHAGRFETSMMLALGSGGFAAPQREGWDAAEAKPYWHEDRQWWERIDGYTDNPAEGTAEEGAACLAAIVTAVAECIVDFDRSTRDRKPG